jgi:hypothetical protein
MRFVSRIDILMEMPIGDLCFHQWPPATSGPVPDITVATGSELHRMESQFCTLGAGRRSFQYERTNMISEASVQVQGALRLSPEQVRELLPQREPFCSSMVLRMSFPASVQPLRF